MSLRSIYSLRVFCDGDSFGKNDNSEFGFYADDFTQTNPVIIGWCESTLAPSTDGATTVDGLLARSYAPIILNVSQLTQDYDIDSPVVNNSGISITIANHEKCLMYIKSQGIELMGLKVRLSLNKFNESGTLTSSAFMFYGEIQDLQMNETSFVISCNNNKFSKESNLLNEGEILTIGNLAETDLSYVKTIRNENFKTLYQDDGQNSFLLIGGYDTFNATTRKRTYQIFFKSSIVIGLDLSNWWMYVEQSATESKGQYRKIISSTEITSLQVDTASITDPAIAGYFASYNDGYYLEVEIEGAYTEGLVVDLCTYVQFVYFDHKYTLSKNTLTGTVDRLYSKVNDIVVPFGDYGYDCTLNTDGTIDLSADYPIDDDTIATYTGLPITDLELVGDNVTERNLREWVYELGDVATSESYKNMHKLYCTNNNGGFVAGVFGGVATVNVLFQWVSEATDRLLTSSSYAEYFNRYTSGSHLVAIQFSLPAIDANFTFKSVHLGLAISSDCNGGITSPGIVCITKQAYGTAKKHFNAPLDHSSGAVQINTMPDFYLSTPMSNNTFYKTDWQWKTPDTAPQTRFTCLELTKLQDIDTVEKYNKILKVGLFFERDAGTDVYDTIRMFEIAVIFKHENSLKEVLV